MMKLNTLLIALAISTSIQAQSYQKIHAKAILVDTHNDILMKATDDAMMGHKTSEFVFDKNLKGKTHSDLARWKEGGLDVQVFSVFCEGTMKNPYHFANRQLDTLDAVLIAKRRLACHFASGVNGQRVGNRAGDKVANALDAHKLG